MRRLLLAATVLLSAPPAEAQQLHTSWYVITHQADGTSSRVDFGPATGVVAVPSNLWKCTYTTPGTLQAHVLARYVTCTDGVGDVSLIARCPDNAAGDFSMRAALSPAGRAGFALAVACETK